VKPSTNDSNPTLGTAGLADRRSRTYDPFGTNCIQIIARFGPSSRAFFPIIAVYPLTFTYTTRILTPILVWLYTIMAIAQRY
jgi:hypothetical protein